MKGRLPGGETTPLDDADGDGLSAPDAEAPAEMLASVTVVPKGVGPGVDDAPGRGVAVAGTLVGRGVGLGVGLAVGFGVVVGGGGPGVGVGVGGVTTTDTGVEDGFVPRLLTAWKITVQEPAGKVLDPVQIPSRGEPEVRVRVVVRVVDPLDATADTLVAVSPIVVLPT